MVKPFLPPLTPSFSGYIIHKFYPIFILDFGFPLLRFKFWAVFSANIVDDVTNLSDSLVSC